MDYVLFGAVALWTAILGWQDWRHRRLPNLLTLGGAGAALMWKLAGGGLPEFGNALAGGLLAGAFFLIPFLLKGAGGGDVKMLFAAGCIVGLGRPLLLLLWYASLMGLILGLTMLAAGRLDGARLKHYVRTLFDWRYDRQAGAANLPPKEAEKVRVPFGLAIGSGLLLVLALPPH